VRERIDRRGALISGIAAGLSLAALRAVAVLPRVVVVFRRAADFAALRVAVARLAVFFVVFFFAFFALRAIAITSSWLSLTHCYLGGAHP